MLASFSAPHNQDEKLILATGSDSVTMNYFKLFQREKVQI